MVSIFEKKIRGPDKSKELAQLIEDSVAEPVFQPNVSTPCFIALSTSKQKYSHPVLDSSQCPQWNFSKPDFNIGIF